MVIFTGGLIMRLNKLYIISVAMILVLCFSFSAACEKVQVTVEESTEETEYTVIEEIEDEFTADEEKEAEEEEKIEEAELTTHEKLDEIEQTYSMGFRQYLETLDESYLGSLLDDDNALKLEYDLYSWRNTFYENNITFTAGGNIFPAGWYGSGIDAKAESLDPGEVERSKSIMITALDKYPTQLLQNILKNVYVLKSMSFYGVNYGGTNSLDSVYAANDGIGMGCTDKAIEQTFHHEFSSVLYNNYRYLFDENGWRQINPAGFGYFDEATGGAGAIKAGKASQVFDPEEHEMGFLYEYAETTLENDVNSFAENIFMGEESFFNTVESYDKLQMKLDLIVAFYNSLDPVFTIDYFKGL
jgi:hypothetical protein